MGNPLTSKERMIRALRGEKPDVLPAAPGYLSLFLADRMRAEYIEQYRLCLNGHSHCRVDHAQDTHFRAQALVRSYSVFKNPPDWIEVETGASRAWAERTEIVVREGVLCYQDRMSAACVPMDAIPLPHGDVPLNEIEPVSHDTWEFSPQLSNREEVEKRMPVVGAEELLGRGDLDLPRQVAADHGDRYFISTILDTPYSDAYGFLGFRALMVIQRRDPGLFHTLLQRRLAQSKETLGAWAATGIHGVYVEEVFTGADAISPDSYDRFVAAYNQPYFQHMRGLGLLPIHYVCGDAIPRLDRMVGYEVAAVALEESKKKFRVEIAEVVERVAGRTAVFGNIDAVRFGIHATPQEMAAEVGRQAAIGAQARGFVVSTGSPFPLETDPGNIDALVAAAHSTR